MVKIETERLRLRPFRSADAGEFARLAGDWAVASMTSDIPYPFSRRQAFAWLVPMRGEVRFAIERDGQLIGGAGFYRRASGTAELDVLLAAERDAARAPIAGSDVDLGSVEDFPRATLQGGRSNLTAPGGRTTPASVSAQLP